MRISCLLLWMISCDTLLAQNPIIRSQYTADPTARVFDGKVYLFPSHDILARPGRGRVGWFCMEDYHVFSSTDLINWADHGVIVSQDKVPWVKPDSYSMWAPDCIERNGKFYFYFPSMPADTSHGRGFTIGVAIADRPEGPYIPQDAPIEGVRGIDPNVFIDKDGQAYLYWAQGNIYAAKLKENMLELASDPVILRDLPTKGLKEGPFLFERKGIYYLTYPHVRNKTESLEYATADNPLGPFAVKGVIMDESPTGCWTNHQSIVEYKDQWYLFYHHNDLSPGFDKARSVRIDSLFFDPDGTIRKVIPTLRGVGTTKATAFIDPDRYSAISPDGASIDFLDTLDRFRGWKTIFAGAGAWVRYNSVDFGDNTLHSVTLRVSSATGGTLQIHADNLDGPLLAEAKVPSGDAGWRIITVPLTRFIPGIHHLFLVSKEEGRVEVDWLRAFHARQAPARRVDIPSLKEVYRNDFLIGTAMNVRQIEGADPRADSLIDRQFNAVTPENCMKAAFIHPAWDTWRFDMADKLVAYAQKHDIHINAHTLIWHSQLPGFVRKMQDADSIRQYFMNHITTLASRYDGKVYSWDVVNEALNEDGSLRNSIFLQKLGPGYVVEAFRLANRAAPHTQLYYNDYGIESPRKRAGAVALVRQIQAAGIRIDAIGIQGHWHLGRVPLQDIEESIDTFAALGIKVNFTELDISVLPNPLRGNTADVNARVNPAATAATNANPAPTATTHVNPAATAPATANPWPDGLPDSVQDCLAADYGALFRLFVKHRSQIGRVTFWGVDDGASWLNNWPIPGRTNYPLLFDRNDAPKKAFYSVIAAATATAAAAATTTYETSRAAAPATPDSAAYYNNVLTYLNPVLPGDHPDPTLLKVGDDFYHCGSSFHFNPYLPIYHSKDLVHWELIGRVIQPSTADSFVTDRPSAGIWQGAITYFYGSYWIYFSANGQWFCKAASPYGPWSAPEKVRTDPTTGNLGYDNSIFVDDDGKPYMLIKNGQRINRIRALGRDGQLTDTVIDLDWINANLQYSWAEGPVMCKRNGYYYYFPAGDVSGGQYVLRTKKLTADSTAWQRLGDFFQPVTDPREGFRHPNHISAPIRLANGTWWTLGQSYERYPHDDWSGAGRQTSLYPVIWKDDRPWGLAPSTLPIVKPDLPQSGIPWTSAQGDDFNDNTLGLQWHFLTRMAARSYSLTARKGWLRLSPEGERAHLVQKETDHYYTAVAKIDLDAIDTAEKAGIWLTNGNQQVSARLYTGFDGGKKIVLRLDTAVREAPNTAGNTVWLKLERKGHELTGYFSGDGRSWTLVDSPVSAVDLDKTQPNFNSWVGTSVGLFAEGRPADFDFFVCKDAFSPLTAAAYANAYGIRRVEQPGEVTVTNTSAYGGWFMLSGVETGGYPAKGIELTVAARTGGNLKLWLDDLGHGTLIATLPVPATGGETRWQTVFRKIKKFSGHHDVFIQYPPGEEGAIFIRSIRFTL